MNGITPWAAAASQIFADDNLVPSFLRTFEDFNFEVHLSNDSLWLLVKWPNGGKIIFRMAYSPDGKMELQQQEENDREVLFNLTSVIGDFSVKLNFPESDKPVLHYTTTLKPHKPLLIPFWPRDIIIPGKHGHPENTAGKIHASQVGTRSGLTYFSLTKPAAGSVLYLQNLTALAEYCQQTETSCKEVVGGQWPELGFSLPSSINKPLKAGKEIIISDAIVIFSKEVPEDEPAMVRQYFDFLAEVYLHLPKPETAYHNWPDILEKGLKDLIDSPGCWSQVDGHAYFNAYVCDYETPPEIMVQLAVLLPLLDYVEWSKNELEVMKVIKEGLPAFYDKEMGTLVRWLPAAEYKLKGEEEQKKPKVMDSWYLHHPLLNLSRLALEGDKVAEHLFLGSMDYTIKVARHFNYQWPVFYQMETLEVLKAETAPGKGGEKDVAGIYAHVMLQAWELTKEKRYLQEAEKAAKTLAGMGFDLFYQANNTAFAAGALLRMAKITGNQLYKELSYLCLANVFKNMHIWDCNYGYGQHFSSFFALFPLSNAPYTAVYEEQEVFCALHDYLKHAQGEDILPSVNLLIAEYIRFLVFRAIYYYPAMLPEEMLSGEVKVGEVDRKLWIALEDIHDGWEKSGEVGQEVYGAGNAFGILPRHYLLIPEQNFMIFVDYPTANYTASKGRPISFSVLGDGRLSCRMMVVKIDKHKLPHFTVTINGKEEEIKGIKTKEGHLEYCIPGRTKVKIIWE